MNNNLEGIDFDKVNSTLAKLPENLSSLGEQMSTFQKTRTEKLIQLNNELTVLNRIIDKF